MNMSINLRTHHSEHQTCVDADPCLPFLHFMACIFHVHSLRKAKANEEGHLLPAITDKIWTVGRMLLTLSRFSFAPKYFVVAEDKWKALRRNKQPTRG